VRPHGGDRKSRRQNGRLDVPTDDPGKDLARRWRETVRPYGGKQYRTVSTEGPMPPVPPDDPGEQVARRWRIKLGTDEAFAKEVLNAAV